MSRIGVQNSMASISYTVCFSRLEARTMIVLNICTWTPLEKG
jgi:hypothetical protein